MIAGQQVDPGHLSTNQKLAVAAASPTSAKGPLARTTPDQRGGQGSAPLFEWPVVGPHASLRLAPIPLSRQAPPWVIARVERAGISRAFGEPSISLSASTTLYGSAANTQGDGKPHSRQAQRGPHLYCLVIVFPSQTGPSAALGCVVLLLDGVSRVFRPFAQDWVAFAEQGIMPTNAQNLLDSTAARDEFGRWARAAAEVGGQHDGGETKGATALPYTRAARVAQQQH
ncbi:hypothetical protein FZEAL_10824, partial [Fusarium zealandicum]